VAQSTARTLDFERGTGGGPSPRETCGDPGAEAVPTETLPTASRNADGERARLQLDSVEAAITAPVRHRTGTGLVVEQPLPFLRIGSGVEEGALRGRIASVGISVAEHVPRLVIGVTYEAPGRPREETRSYEPPCPDESSHIRGRRDETVSYEAASSIPPKTDHASGFVVAVGRSEPRIPQAPRVPDGMEPMAGREASVPTVQAMGGTAAPALLRLARCARWLERATLALARALGALASKLAG
jgi:hypothetical protein